MLYYDNAKNMFKTKMIIIILYLLFSMQLVLEMFTFITE